MSFIVELKQRKVFRVAAVYLLVAWVAIQAASIALPAFDAPAWTLRVVILLFALGLPLALLLAWALELTPEGVKFDTGKAGSRRMLLATGALMLLVLGWYFHDRSLPAQAKVAHAAAQPAPIPAPVAADKHSIAVLPFTNMSPNPEDDFFGEGITEDLLTQLAHIKGLKVISRTSVMQYKNNTTKSLREIAHELGVTTILEGSVRRGDNRYRISAQLIDAETDRQLWAKSYDREFKDLLAVQAEVTSEIADALQVELQDSEKQYLSKYAKGNAEAYLHYIKGMQLVYPKPNQPFAELEAARAEFEQVVALDPDSPLGYSGLADYWFAASMIRESGVSRADAIAKAESQNARALALDPDSPEALLTQSLILGEGLLRWSESEASVKRAVTLAPNCADCWQVYAARLEFRGQLTEALEATQRALALDPNSPLVLREPVYVYHYLRRYQDAIRAARALLVRYPEDRYTHEQIATELEMLGKFEAAVEEYGLAGADARDTESLRRALGKGGAKAYWAERYAQAVRRAKAGSESNVFSVPNVEAAKAAAMSGKREEALSWLERAYDARDFMPDLKVEPIFASLRDEPRFQAILRKMKLL